jgi:hypothetical protein
MDPFEGFPVEVSVVRACNRSGRLVRDGLASEEAEQ